MSVEGDNSFLRLGGKLIDIKGISTDVKSAKVHEIMNLMKDESAGNDKILVLLHNKSNDQALSPVYTDFKLQKQEFSASTSSKYVDIKIKKASCKIELNSNSNHSLVFDELNQKFIQYIKVFLQGRCNLSSMKVLQAMSLNIVDSLNFEVQKYADSAKVLDDLKPMLPSSINKLSFTHVTNMSTPIDKQSELKADTNIMKLNKAFPKMQIMVESSQASAEKRIFYMPIMDACQLNQVASKNCGF